MKFSETQEEQIAEILKSHGVNLPCPRCGSEKPFNIVSGYLKEPIHNSLKGAAVILNPESYIPAIVTACPQCGFICLHSTNILGIKEDIVDKGAIDKK